MEVNFYALKLRVNNYFLLDSALALGKGYWCLADTSAGPSFKED